MAGVVAPSITSTEVALADRGDDAGLRRLLRASVMPGTVRVAFTREPDYFAADGLAGADDVTVVARRHGEVVGAGRCSLYSLMRNGTPRRIGYLGLLRVADETRASPRLIREGYDLLGDVVRTRAEGFFTSIAIDNVRARRVLELGGRLGLPSYRRLCDLVTMVAPVRPNDVAEVEPPSESELGSFLNDDATRFQLALPWNGSLWQSLRQYQVSVRDFAVVRRGGRIVAAAAVWDQRAFRQTVIDGYEGVPGRIRPLVNAAAAMLGRPALPAPGTVLAQGSILGASVPDPRDWNTLWSQLQQRAGASGLSWLVISRDARDPELAILRRLTRAREFVTTLYDVVWPGAAGWSEPWDARLFRPEVSLL